MAKKDDKMSKIKFITGILFWVMLVFRRAPRTGLFVLFFAIIGYAIYFFISKVPNSDKYKALPKKAINKQGNKYDIDKDYNNKDYIDKETELNVEGFSDMPDSQKRLENLKNLYDNGFMEKEEYDEKRKKIMESI